MKINDYPKREKIKALWDELFDSQILKFEDFWHDTQSLMVKVKHLTLKRWINKGYSGTECILLAKWFAEFDIDYANKLFSFKHSNENRLYGDGIYKYKLFRKTIEEFPDILKTP